MNAPANVDVLADYFAFLADRARLARNPDVKLAYDKAANRFRTVYEAVAELIHVVGEESTHAEHYGTVYGAANLTAHDWIARAIETLREADDGKNAVIGDVLDDLQRAQSRIREALARINMEGN